MARILTWLTAMFVLSSWSAPTTRVVVTVFLVVMAALGLVWLLTGASDLAGRWRERLDVSITNPTPSQGRNGRLRGNIVAILALLFVFWPAWSKPIIVGFFLVMATVMILFEIPEARRLAQSEESTDDAMVVARSRRRYVLAAGVLAGAVALGATTTASAAERVAVSAECNGHEELCARRIDEVVFAGSHNAMSSSELGWDLALQTGDMIAQLDYGVRALLIDGLYWDSDGALEGGDEALAAAVIESALSDDEPKSGTWLCHGFCALGATDFTSGLADITIWLDSHPREVVLIVLQDEISTTDVMTAFDGSGLAELVYLHQPGTQFPTLGELVDVNQRVLVYAENEGSPESWYQNAWDSAFTETPYTFGLRSDFSCVANRGEPDNPLFLLNHWLTTGIPAREVALSVNSQGALLERVRECERERGRLPTVLATDFVETGDLILVVDILNEVTSN